MFIVESVASQYFLITTVAVETNDHAGATDLALRNFNISPEDTLDWHSDYYPAEGHIVVTFYI